MCVWAGLSLRWRPFSLFPPLPFFAPVHCRLSQPLPRSPILLLSSPLPLLPVPSPCGLPSRPASPSPIYLPSWAPFSSHLSLQSSAHQRQPHGSGGAASRLLPRPPAPRRGHACASPQLLAGSGHVWAWFLPRHGQRAVRGPLRSLPRS